MRELRPSPEHSERKVNNGSVKNLADSTATVGAALCVKDDRAASVCRLFVSPDHNFFGHHGRPAGQNPMVEVEQIECVAGRGIRRDRFFDYKDNYKGQITFFSQEVFEAMKAHFGLMNLEPSAIRRNVLVSGVQLKELIRARFEFQGVIFEGVEECRPCYWMDSAVADGAEEWLRGRGGLRARILTHGVLRRSALS